MIAPLIIIGALVIWCFVEIIRLRKLKEGLDDDNDGWGTCDD